MNKVTLVIITLLCILGIGLIFFGDFKNQSDEGSLLAGQNVEVREGVQYITIKARGGYFPKVSTAQAGIPTKLIMKTNGAYDCSLALVIRSIGYQKILSQTGEEIIDIGIPVSGVPLKGTCSMGMYSFVVNFD